MMQNENCNNSPNTLDFLWVEVTNRCNLTCKHCYSKSGPNVDISREMSLNEYKSVVGQAANLGCRSIQFIGGEPTVYPHITDLILHAKHSGFEDIEVFTNLVVLKDEILELVRNGTIHLATSFYSSESKVHGEITGREASFKRIVKNIKKVVDAGGMMRACVPLMKANKDEYDRTISYLENLGVQNIRSDTVREFGRAANNDKECMGNLCGACAGNVACVDPTGLVSPCIMSKKWRLGDTSQESLADILSCSSTKKTRQAISDSVKATSVESACLPQTCLPNGPDCLPKNCLPQSPGVTREFALEQYKFQKG